MCEHAGVNSTPQITQISWVLTIYSKKANLFLLCRCCCWALTCRLAQILYIQHCEFKSWQETHKGSCACSPTANTNQVYVAFFVMDSRPTTAHQKAVLCIGQHEPQRPYDAQVVISGFHIDWAEWLFIVSIRKWTPAASFLDEAKDLLIVPVLTKYVVQSSMMTIAWID